MKFIGISRSNSGWRNATVYELATERYGSSYGNFSHYSINNNLCKQATEAPDRKDIYEYVKNAYISDKPEVSVYNDFDVPKNSGKKHENAICKDIYAYEIKAIMKLFNSIDKGMPDKKKLVVSDGLSLYRILTSSEDELGDIHADNIILVGTNIYNKESKEIKATSTWYSSDTMSKLFLFMCRTADDKEKETLRNNRLFKELLEKRHLLVKNPYLLAAMASYSGNKEVAKSILRYIWRNVDKDHIDYYLLSNITESIANDILEENDVNEVLYSSKSILNHNKLEKLHRIYRYSNSNHVMRYKLNDSIYKNYILNNKVYLGLEKFANDLTNEELKRLDVNVLDKAVSNSYVKKDTAQRWVEQLNKLDDKTPDQVQWEKRLTYVSSGMNKSSNNEGYKALFTFIDMADKEKLEKDKVRIANIVIEWMLRSNNYCSSRTIMYTNPENHEMIAKEVFNILNTQNIRSIRSYLKSMESKHHHPDHNYNAFSNTCYFDMSLCDASNKKLFKAYTEMTLS